MMSRRLTAEELKEPDVVLYIPYPVWFGLLESTRKTIEHFNYQHWPGGVRVILPAYRARALERDEMKTIQQVQG